jgi:hypothetical protein
MISNPIPWPNGAKCAVCFTFDMDADSILHLAHPKDGHEIAHHGYIHEHPNELSRDLLLEEEIDYDASLMGDDIPYIIENQSGSLVELPSHWGLDDWPPYVHMSEIGYNMPIKAPEDAVKVFRAEFDAMWQCGGLWVSVWHPFVSGRLARWLEAERLIEYMAGKGEVWFARMDQVASHVRQVIADGAYTPRIDRLPFYAEPVEIGRPGFAKA